MGQHNSESLEPEEAFLIEVPLSPGEHEEMIIGKEVSDERDEETNDAPTERSNRIAGIQMQASSSNSQFSHGISKDESNHATLNIDRQKLIDSVIRKSIFSSPQRIVKAYKRRAILKHLPQHISKLLKPPSPSNVPESLLEDGEALSGVVMNERASSIALGDKLGKCGVTMKKIVANHDGAANKVESDSPSNVFVRPTSVDHKVVPAYRKSVSESIIQPQKVATVGFTDAPPNDDADTINYIIPQNLLMSKTDTVANMQNTIRVVAGTTCDPPKVIKRSVESEFHLVESEQDDERLEHQSKNRRKTTLVPKHEAEEMLFEEKPFQIMSRPQANNDLIENLALYQVLVQQLTKRLKMPNFELSDDGEDHINTYKIFRN